MSSSSPSFARLTSTNYTTWSGDMEAWLKSQGLWRIVPGSQKRPELKPPSASHSSPFPSTGHCASAPLDLIHTHLSGPLSASTPAGYQYCAFLHPPQPFGVDAAKTRGHWPRHFKESTSVIIPKPNKPSYSSPKAFRSIVLLNTLGKLIEKMISNRFQHDMIKYDLVDPNQMGGVRQRSTEDAGLLTHLVRSGWAQKLQTSVVAFDVAQFFPSINHQFLLVVLEKLGFNCRVVAFFGSYLVDRFTTYAWNRDTSDPRTADAGVGQGSALSAVLSALVIAPVMKLFRKRSSGLGCTLISYVDDGDIIVQSDSHPLRQKVVRDAITETSGKIHTLTEVFSPTAEGNTPGERLLDRHQGRVLFDEFDPKGEDALPKRRTFLDTLQRQAAQQQGTVCCGKDCSVPKRTAHQATASFVIERAGHNPATSAWAAEVVRATTLDGCDRIIVFTDSLSSARRLVDPSVHSGQAHSLAVCKALDQWLLEGEDRYIEFIGTPSKLEWGVQHKQDP
ncbi:hypothetical protein H1R20_g13405, partial [Candolleomyces eurysporus]